MALLTTDRADAEALVVMHSWAATSGPMVVLVSRGPGDVDLMAVVAPRAMAMIPRNLASAGRLGLTIAAVAAGLAIMPSHLLGALM